MDADAESAVRRTAGLTCAVALMATCAVSFVMAPVFTCLMDNGCIASDWSYTAYPRAIAVACFVSYAVLLRRRGTAAVAYRRAVAACELYAPAPAADRRRCARFRGAYTALCATITVPVNVMRAYLMHARRTHPVTVAFFVAMYAQNAAMCLLETRFVALCYGLRVRFGHVNRDLERLAAERSAGEDGVPPPATPRRVVYGGDFYGSSSSAAAAAAAAGPATSDPRPRWPRQDSTANVVEIARVRHRLVREAIYALVDLFGVPVGMSLSALGVISLFDVYYEVFSVAGADSRLPVFIYMWMLQYSVRFYAIVATAHQMTKQVGATTSRRAGSRGLQYTIVTG